MRTVTVDFEIRAQHVSRVRWVLVGDVETEVYLRSQPGHEAQLSLGSLLQ